MTLTSALTFLLTQRIETIWIINWCPPSTQILERQSVGSFLPDGRAEAARNRHQQSDPASVYKHVHRLSVHLLVVWPPTLCQPLHLLFRCWGHTEWDSLCPPGKWQRSLVSTPGVPEGRTCWDLSCRKTIPEAVQTWGCTGVKGEAGKPGSGPVC